MKLHFHDDLVAAGHAFDTTRKPGWIADSLRQRPVKGVQIVGARPADDDRLGRVHTAHYVQAVRSGKPRCLAESQGFPWDVGVHRAAAASAGAASDAARAALEDGVAGALSTGLHHATYTSGAGFCTFNGLALAAFEALDAGARSVLVLDLDAHCGGGTHSIVHSATSIRQIDVSVSAVDGYTPSAGNTLDLVDDVADYLPTIRRRLREAGRWCADGGLVIYNAGMDPCLGQPRGPARYHARNPGRTRGNGLRVGPAAGCRPRLRPSRRLHPTRRSASRHRRTASAHDRSGRDFLLIPSRGKPG